MQRLLRPIDSLKVLGRLRIHLHLGELISSGREAVDHWLKGSGRAHRIPEGVSGITTVRSLAQWVLDYHADGRGQGFPFDLPWLSLSGRGLPLSAALQTFLRIPPADVPVRKSLETLQRMLRPLEGNDPPFLLIQDALAKRADLFDRLRTALRLEQKNPTPKKLNAIQAALRRLAASLRKERPKRGPAKDTRQAIDLILALWVLDSIPALDRALKSARKPGASEDAAPSG